MIKEEKKEDIGRLRRSGALGEGVLMKGNIDQNSTQIEPLFANSLRLRTSLAYSK